MGFQQGLSGLTASSQSLDVIGNNIANANTVGMKSSRAEFSEIVASAIGTSGGTNSGIGVTVNTTAQNYSQGTINVTGNNLDVAINGGGFFQLTETSGTTAYTRAGNFKLDANGDIVTDSGAKLMGYPTDTKGNATSSTPIPLTLPTGADIAANQTTTITGQFNLDASAAIDAGGAASPTLTKYGTSFVTYDAQGVQVPVAVYFQKTAVNTWTAYTSINGVTPPTAVATPIVFNTDGTLASGSPINLALTSANGPFTPAAIPLNLTGTTQYATSFAANNITQDGYTAGQLTGVQIGPNGILTATYSNGQSQSAGQVALASFRNNQGLTQINGGDWIQSFASGTPTLGSPGSGNLGSLQSGALEESNVDLTQELVNMMTAQRTYQANAQTIKTQDQILSTLVNLR
jgi:flagellar hook protein FlgE